MIARACPVPRDSLLQVHAGRAGSYTDCFEVMHPLEADLPAFVQAFYSTWLFRIERVVLSVVLRRRITNADLQALATGKADGFAAWRVEARDGTQILLCDLAGYTRSYLAVAPKDGGVTRLLFGSAVVARDTSGMGHTLRTLLPLHRLYSRLLLRLAERRLRRG